jgi:hypothetical protein
MLRNVSILFIAAAAAVWSAGDLFAQQQGFGGGLVSGQSGGGGSSSFGSSGSSFGGTSSGSTGGSSMGSSTGAGLSMLNATSLSGGFGLLGFGAANGFSSGSMYGGRSYGSVTSAGGSSMTGSTAGGTRTTGSSTSSSGSGRGGSTSTANTGRRGSTQTKPTTAKKEQFFEPRIEVGFDVAPQKTTAVALNVVTSLGVTKAGSRFGGVRVAIDGQTAILRGVVASQNDRQLAEQITLLEPDVSSVRNELLVRTPTTVPSNTR